MYDMRLFREILDRPNQVPSIICIIIMRRARGDKKSSSGGSYNMIRSKITYGSYDQEAIQGLLNIMMYG